MNAPGDPREHTVDPAADAGVPAGVPAGPDAPDPIWEPLRIPVFRLLWLVGLTANVSMAMNDVAAAWMMTTLTRSPAVVALVQTAATLPIFLLGLPSGALADILDRRRYLITTQFWVAGVGIVLCLLTLTEALSAPLLLALVFANGIGLAMRWPVLAALIPELVPRALLPNALGVNGISMNASRILGPTIAGAIIASFGSQFVFLLNAVLSLGAALALLRWRRQQKTSALPAERFFGALRVGLQYVRQSPQLHVIYLRIASFFLFSTALTALLPLEARRLPGGGAGTFTVLLVLMGAGAITAMLNLPRLRRLMDREQLVRNGTLLQAGAMAAVALSPNLWLAAPAMFLAGMGWITTANSLTVSAQLALPDWVKARGMSVYQMALMGGAALGAALWGQVADATSVTTSMLLASAGAVLTLLLMSRMPIAATGGDDEDLTPIRIWSQPELAFPVQHDQGPIVVTITYRIDPARHEEFVALMESTRRSRLRNGALSWGLFRDMSDGAQYVEYFTDESWVEYLRRQERMTAADIVLRDQRLAFHAGPEPPVIARFVAEPTGASRPA